MLGGGGGGEVPFYVGVSCYERDIVEVEYLVQSAMFAWEDRGRIRGG